MASINVLPIIGWLLVAIGIYCASRARLLDRQLRRLVPRPLEQRWRRELFRRSQHADPFDFDTHRGDDVFLSLPLRWNRDIYGPRDVHLVDRLLLFIAGACFSTLLGLLLISDAYKGG